MTEFFHTPMFGIFLTCLAWTVGVWLQKKTGWKLCYPLVVATAFVIGVLLAVERDGSLMYLDLVGAPHGSVDTMLRIGKDAPVGKLYRRRIYHCHNYGGFILHTAGITQHFIGCKGRQYRQGNYHCNIKKGI